MKFVVAITWLVVCNVSTAAWAAPPKKLGPCGLAGERQVWQRDAVETEEDAFDLSDPLPSLKSQKDVLKKGCGIRTRLLDTVEDGVIVIRLAGGEKRAFLPLHLSDKTKGFYCGAIRPKIACVTEAKAAADGSVDVLMRASASGPASEIRIKVDRQGAPAPAPPYFALLPVQRKVGGNFQDLRALIRDAAKAVNCDNKSQSDCLADRQYAAERRAMEFVRIDRRSRLAKPDRTQDVSAFLAKYAAQDGDALLAHRAIVVNEIGVTANPEQAYASPYEVLDAVLMASGPSFGAHQVDVGTNDSEDLAPFRAAMKRIAARDDAAAALKAVEASKGFERPGREYDTVTLATFHASMPSLTAILRTSEGRSGVDATYDRYLERAAGCFALLRQRGLPFTASKFAMLYVVDVANQSGRSVGRDIAALASRMVADGKSVADVEAAMVDNIMDRKPGKPERDDVARRVKQIRDVIKAWGDKPLGGGVTSKCDITGI